MRSLLVVVSYHHKNTEKIAKIFAKVLGAEIKTPQQIKPEELKGYELIGFGSGIYRSKHHQILINFAGQLPKVNNKKAFIFSTCELRLLQLMEDNSMIIFLKVMQYLEKHFNLKVISLSVRLIVQVGIRTNF